MASLLWYLGGIFEGSWGGAGRKLSEAKLYALRSTFLVSQKDMDPMEGLEQCPKYGPYLESYVHLRYSTVIPGAPNSPK